MTSTAGSSLSPGAVLSGRYRVDVEVGRGGFGAVYRGHHLVLDVPIAIKVMFPRADATGKEAEALIAEAHLTARLQHPAIARVLDANLETSLDSGSLAYLVLEWIEGVSLARAVAEAPRREMPPGDAFRLLRPVMSALAYAHAQGLVHRDVKPANIMLTGEGPIATRQAKLVDFGVGKFVGSDIHAPSLDDRTRRGGGFTLAYAAPEQVLGSKTGSWTDIHAIGLLFTELVTGRRPFGDGDDLDGVLTKTRPTPRAFGKNVGALEEILARCVAIDPRERPPTMRALLDELDHHFRNVPSPRRFRAALYLLLTIGLVASSIGIGLLAWPRELPTPRTASSPSPLPPRPPGSVEERPVPRYTLESLRERATAAGFDILMDQEDKTNGQAPRLSLTLTGPCDLSVSQVEMPDVLAAKGIETGAASNSYFARAAGKRVLSVTFPSGKRDCAADLFEKLMR